MNLPEKLRNLGLKPAPKDNEKVHVILSDNQIRVLADVMLPISSNQGA